ncbi:Vps62-related protein [Pyxidicoccus sp. 3LG]
MTRTVVLWLVAGGLLGGCTSAEPEVGSGDSPPGSTRLALLDDYVSGIVAIPAAGSLTGRLVGTSAQACLNLCDGRSDCVGFYIIIDANVCELYGAAAETAGRIGPWSNVRMHWKKKHVDPHRYESGIWAVPNEGAITTRLYGYQPQHCAALCDGRSDCIGFHAFTDWDTCMLYGPAAENSSRGGPWANVKMYWRKEVDSYITVFEHGAHQGASQPLRPGRYDIHHLSVGNDKISSLKIPSNWRVTLYEHSNWTGRFRLYTQDTHLGGTEFDEVTSSLTVEPPLPEVYGNWRSSGGRDAYHAGNREFLFDLAGEAGQVTFDLGTTPSSLDAYLYLLDTHGTILGQNDNREGSLDSRLTLTLQPGSYRLIAATSSPGANGGFKLSASRGILRPPTGALEVAYANQFTPVWNDSGSGAHLDGAFYKPTAPPGYYVLGDYAQGNHSTPTGTSLVVKELEAGALAKPASYQFIYNDRHSSADQNGAFWKPIPPAGYACLGILVKGDYETLTDRDDIRCVRQDLVTGAKAGNVIWNDKGRWSPQPHNFGAWESVPSTALGLSTGTFAAKSGENPLWCEDFGCAYNTTAPSLPLGYDVYTLDRNAVENAAGLAAISAELSSDWNGKTWGLTQDNALPGSWLQATPAGIWGKTYAEFPQAVTCAPGEGASTCNLEFNRKLCTQDSDCGTHGMCRLADATISAPGGTAQKLCVEHSWETWNNMYKTMVAGDYYVDVTALKKVTGPFLAATRNAIGYLSRKSGPPRVRILLGDALQNSWSPCSFGVDATSLLQQLTQKVSPGSGIQVYLGSMRSGIKSWNHSKIVAADGRDALVGGHNTWEHSYLADNPVFDVSMKVRGSAAASAQYYANTLWDRTWTLRTSGSGCAGAQVKLYENGSIQDATSAPSGFNESHHVQTSGGTIPVLAIGRLGTNLDGGNGDQSDKAILALIRQARSSVYMSLQDIGPPDLFFRTSEVWIGWPKQLFSEIGMALKRGVVFRVVLSNPSASYGHSYNWTLQYVMRRLYDTLWYEFPSADKLKQALCKNFQLATLRYSPTENEYPHSDVDQNNEETGRKGIANHAKSILVDQRLFFMSSQNLYVSDLSEFGYIVEHADTAAAYYSSYWSPLWQNSQRTRISGFAENEAGYQACMTMFDRTNL